MHIDFILKEFEEHKNETAIVWKDKTYTYNSLLENYFHRKQKLTDEYKVLNGSVVALEGDFTPNTIALLLALIENNNIIVPLNYSFNLGKDELINISQPEIIIKVNEDDEINIETTDLKPDNELIKILRERNNPGLILFSSGTSGKSKAAVHDFTKLLNKFKTKREALVTMNFLLFDHWGGLNTLFHTLSNGGTVVTAAERSPDYICSLIEKYKIELLPSSPTFLNLILISEVYKRFDLSSLKIISYGTEPMSASTLQKLNTVFPNVKFRQTYGLIEVGVLRTKSKDDGSLWLKLGGEGFDVRVQDNILQIKSESAILGYLNYPSPFTEDGYFITGDEVLTDGEYFKILGRRSEIINVGGEKVYPAEIESVIKEMENVADVSVYGEKNPITGNIVCANVSLIKEEDKSEFKSRLKKHCREKLQIFKVPAKINIVDKINIGERFKKKIVKQNN